MRTNLTRIVTTCLCAFMLALAVGCSSSAKTSSPTTNATAPSTTAANAPTTPAPDPDLIPNAIPFNVGERMGLPNGWLVEVTKVHRPFTHVGLAAAPAGQEWVAVDLTMQYNGTATHTVKAASLFALVDGAGQVHQVVRPPGGTNGIDGTYTRASNHAGQLVFLVPAAKTLKLTLDGPQIGTQRSIFQVDPPKAPSTS